MTIQPSQYVYIHYTAQNNILSKLSKQYTKGQRTLWFFFLSKMRVVIGCGGLLRATERKHQKLNDSKETFNQFKGKNIL